MPRTILTHSDKVRLYDLLSRFNEFFREGSAIWPSVEHQTFDGEVKTVSQETTELADKLREALR